MTDYNQRARRPHQQGTILEYGYLIMICQVLRLSQGFLESHHTLMSFREGLGAAVRSIWPRIKTIRRLPTDPAEVRLAARLVELLLHRGRDCQRPDILMAV